jgi:glycosyl hydrolase family 113
MGLNMRAIGLWLRWATKKPKRPPSWAHPTIASAVIFSAIAWTNIRSESMPDRRLDGFNVIATAADPFGSAAANLALAKAKEVGASAVAVIPFVWQPNAASPDLTRGNDMNDDELRAAIREAHAVGLAVLVKPHVWVPQSWAGAVTMHSQADWQKWFASYQREITHIAQIAESEKAEALAIGTELSQTILLPQWNDLIVETRGAFSGRLLYVAHNVEEAETVPFWDRLDDIGVSLYPPLGNDDDRDYRRAAMRAAADRLDMLAVIYRKPVLIAEVGLRSAAGAAAKPWESAEERAATADPALQADVLADWLTVLDRPTIGGVMIWRWFTDPDAGGLADTDFTVQGKPAEQVLRCAWIPSCGHG